MAKQHNFTRRSWESQLLLVKLCCFQGETWDIQIRTITTFKKTPFIFYYDAEEKVVKCDKKNVPNHHEIIAY